MGHVVKCLLSTVDGRWIAHELLERLEIRKEVTSVVSWLRTFTAAMSWSGDFRNVRGDRRKCAWKGVLSNTRHTLSRNGDLMKVGVVPVIVMSAMALASR
jgi:hypothetical protein